MSFFTTHAQAPRYDLTPQERNHIFSVLSDEHYFDLDALLNWLESMRHSAFWEFGDGQSERNYSPAQSMYLDLVYTASAGATYDSCMRELAALMWEARFKPGAPDAETFGLRFTPAMDAALCTLIEDMRHYKALHEFDQPRYRIEGDAITPEAVKRIAAMLAQQETKIETTTFALQWLTFHVRYFAQQYRDAKQAEQGAGKGGNTDGDGSMRGMEPGDFIP